MTDRVTVPANLVRYVRRGLHTEFSAAAERAFLIELQDLTEEQFDAALETLDAVRTLLKNVGFVDEGSGHDIELDISPDPVIVHRGLECQYHAQVDRVEESAQATSPNSGSSDEIWALGELLATLKAGADSAREERRRRGSRH
jgi:hypothetical protein